MLPLPNIEEIQNYLLEIPALVNLYEARDGEFLELVKTWMQRLESSLHENRLPIAGTVAGLRATIISAERRPTVSGQYGPSSSSQKVRDGVAADALKRAEEIVFEHLRPDLAQLRDAERIVRHMLAIAQFRGIGTSADDLSYSDLINTIWTNFLRDPELAPMAVRMTGLVGAHNALFVLSNELPRN